MDWVLRSPQIHSTFSNLGYVKIDGYHVNENCNAVLETILQNILSEDKFLRSYRRSISFGQNIQKDLIPLLIHAKEDKTIELIIRILVNLSIPTECLLNVEFISKSDYGRHTIFEINNLLAATKVAFTELRTAKAVVDFLRRNIDVEDRGKFSEEQRENVSNCLLLMRNILHIPDDNVHIQFIYSGTTRSVQNQFLWNIFSLSLDKIIIKLMTISDASFWGVTIVQVISLLYKDQHVVILQCLLNNWLTSSLSESSEDNESNTTPQYRGSESSQMLTSSGHPSDSSDNGDDSSNSIITTWDNDPPIKIDDHKQKFLPAEVPCDVNDVKTSISQKDQLNNTGDDKSPRFGTNHLDQIMLEVAKCMRAPNNRDGQNKNQKHTINETSDCGYGTQIENQESISTSSNDDDMPRQKPVHQKPHNLKKKPNIKFRTGATLQERKRKKMIKRGKTNIINVQGLLHKMPSDDDISFVLKEFTVDFLLKGYNSLVHTLHSEILKNHELKIDTSHFFWLLTYFLKFAKQIELDLEFLNSVLTFEMVSYLTFEGVNLCEQFELAIKVGGCDLSLIIRKQHLALTSIREFVQAIQVYKKVSHLKEPDREMLKNLEIKMCETEDLRSMMVLLLRHYDPKYHSRQYLQDIIVTNHILLMSMDNVMKIPDYICSTNMIDHIRQFATPEIMANYGLLLSNYLNNGEFVNNCVFTMMHHVGGDMGKLETLRQPIILKSFAAICKSGYEICEDFNDLILYVINKFGTKPDPVKRARMLQQLGIFEPEAVPNVTPVEPMSTDPIDIPVAMAEPVLNNVTAPTPTLERWTEEEVSSLSWIYMQCSAHYDVIGSIMHQLKEDSINKSRGSVIGELFRQNLISKEFYEIHKAEYDGSTNTVNKEAEIKQFYEELIKDGKSTALEWLQKVLLEICLAKLYIQKKKLQQSTLEETKSKLLNFEIFKVKYDDMPIVSPVVYHSLIYQESVPLISWNCDQVQICKDPKFMQLLELLGFQMPAETGKIYIRIPHFWTADFIYGLADQIHPIDTSKLKFSVSELSEIGTFKTKLEDTALTPHMVKHLPLIVTTENFFEVCKQNLATLVNFTPRPASAFSPENKVEPLNWLQVVQKSQDRKIHLNIESLKNTEDVVMESASEDCETTAVPKSQVSLFQAVVLQSGTAVPLPTIKQETAPINETDYCNSGCDTASVASDLTRMYVSDEDEKPEEIVRPDVDKSTIVKKTSRNKTKTCGKRRRE